MNQMEDNAIADSPHKDMHIKSILNVERLPVLIALSTSLLYVFGFVAFNSYLASKGIYDQTLLSTKYIMAGGLVLIILGGYYYFVWRKILDRIKRGVVWHKPISPIFRVFLDFYYVTEFVFGCAMLVAWLAGLLMPDVYALFALLATGLAFIFDMALIHYSVYKKYRLLAFVLSFTFYWMAIFAYAVWGLTNPPLLSLWGIFVSFTILGSIVLSSPSWADNRDKGYSIFYLSIYVVVSVAGIGATTLEYINPRFGGAVPSKVTVSLAREIDDEIKRQFTAVNTEVYLIQETDDVSIFLLKTNSDFKKYIRLDKKFVTALTYEPLPPKELELLHLRKALGII